MKTGRATTTMAPSTRQLIFSAAILIILVILITLAVRLWPPPSPDAVPTENGSIEVHFCPTEGCEALLLAAINASADVQCAFYDIDLPSLQGLLVRKDASVLVFDENYKGYGTPVANPRSGLMHDKFCVLDSETVITGSANPTSGIFKNDNNIVIIRGRFLAKNYLAELEELKTGKERAVPFPLITHTVNNNSFLIESYFCPEDGCAERVIDVLGTAKRSVKFLTYSFTDDRIGDVLVRRAAAGVNVSGVFEKSQESQYSEYTGLKAAGLDVRLDGNPSLMHHKVFIIDSETVITGSYNPTKNGDERNDENVLIIHDAAIAAQYGVEFRRVLAAAK